MTPAIYLAIARRVLPWAESCHVDTGPYLPRVIVYAEPERWGDWTAGPTTTTERGAERVAIWHAGNCIVVLRCAPAPEVDA